MSKHTPGPWTTDDINIDNDELLRIARKSISGKQEWESPIAECFFDDAETLAEVANGIGLVTALANARLIAAAPELLEALEGTLHFLATYPSDAPYKTWKQAKAAIAKAVGKP
jgi:hypothetical protein